MGAFANVQAAADYFKDDRFATENGIELVALTDDSATAKMVITPSHRNALGAVMGGAIFTLGDLAISAHGCNLHLPVVGADANIHYLSGAKGDVLFAKTKCLKNGRTTAIIEAEISDDTGRLIAFMTATCFKL